MTTGEKIRNRRLELHMTMEELGQAIGVQRSAINKYEKGLVDIKSSTLQAIANALGVPPVSLLEETGDEPKNDDVRLLLQEMNRMTPEQIEQVKGMFRVMFKKNEKGTKEDDA